MSPRPRGASAITLAEADAITARLAGLCRTTPAKMRAYLGNNTGDHLGEDGRVVTGWRMQRGSHGFTLVRDPKGTDPAPHVHENRL